MRAHGSSGAPVNRAELEAALAPRAMRAAESGGASAAPRPALIVENVAGNRYAVELALIAEDGIEGLARTVEAINLAEPFESDGELAEDTPVLLWPSQGRHVFFASAATASAANYWARIISGEGPAYAVRRQIATGAAAFTDAPGATDVSAANVWELSVDGSATANVPAGAIVRLWEEPDSQGQTRRFFSYPIHAVYR